MTASFCWVCGKNLTKKDGVLVFETLEVEPGRIVAVHVACKKRQYEARGTIKDDIKKYLSPEHARKK